MPSIRRHYSAELALKLYLISGSALRGAKEYIDIFGAQDGAAATCAEIQTAYLRAEVWLRGNE